jgi:hypothetical protein
MVFIEDDHRTDFSLAEAKVCTGGVNRYTFRTSHFCGGVLRPGKVAPPYQQGKIGISSAYCPGSLTTNRSGAAQQ